MEYAEIVEPFERMLEAVSPPDAVRAVERGEGFDAMWNEISASGFLDALVSETAGGFGLPARAVEQLWQALGRHAVPLPVGETMIARALLAEAGQEVPNGPIALAIGEAGKPVIVPMGLVTRHFLVQQGAGLSLVAVQPEAAQPTGVAGSFAARIQFNALPGQFAAPPQGLRAQAALLRAALIAGAADRLLGMTSAYANERVQFGKPIGRQQALQQQMAVMAEQAVAARFASQIGCAGGLPPALSAVATAKSVASKAAAEIAAIAHAVHGAIGISAEFDLNLYTRRLHEWRLGDGSESYWNRLLGAERLLHPTGSVDYIRQAIAEPAPAA